MELYEILEKVDSQSEHLKYMDPISDFLYPLNYHFFTHSLPPGAAYTSGLSHDRFTCLKDGKEVIMPKSNAI